MCVLCVVYSHNMQNMSKLSCCWNFENIFPREIKYCPSILWRFFQFCKNVSPGKHFINCWLMLHVNYRHSSIYVYMDFKTLKVSVCTVWRKSRWILLDINFCKYQNKFHENTRKTFRKINSTNSEMKMHHGGLEKKLSRKWMYPKCYWCLC